MRKFDLSLRSSRSSYFATFRHQLTILSKTDALDEEKWLNMLGTLDRKSGSAGMPRPISYAVFCLKKKKIKGGHKEQIDIAVDVVARSNSSVSEEEVVSSNERDLETVSLN